MWQAISIVLLVIEAALLADFIVGRIRKQQRNAAYTFVICVFVVNLALYFVPYLYGALKQAENDVLLELFTCVLFAVKNFLIDMHPEVVMDFAAQFPVFSYAYVLGCALALLGTVSAALAAFGNDLVNRSRLKKRLKQPVCDIVIGASENARLYVKNSETAIFLLSEDVDKVTVTALEEEGFAVLRKSLTAELLQSKRLRDSVTYHIICPAGEDGIAALNAFVAYRKQGGSKRIDFYLEQEGDRAEATRKELVEKNGLDGCVHTFCSNEMLARVFTERHPVTEKLPLSWTQADGSMSKDVKITYYFLGFGRLSYQLYRQSVLNNQLVCFADGKYEALPISYRIYDTEQEQDDWSTQGVQNAIARLSERKEEYFPMPELSFRTETIPKSPSVHSTLQEVADAIEKDSYAYVFVDVGDACGNVAVSARLNGMLSERENYHIFARTNSEFVENSAHVTYYGDPQSVYSHDVIVDDRLSAMAKGVNRTYTAKQYASESGRADFDDFVAKKAEESWQELDGFTLYSNLYAATNLRLKLHLLGLDYVADGKGENLGLIEERYPLREDLTYEDYFTQSKRNAFLAQEHARWNTYHLICEYLPMQKSGITVKSNDGEHVKFFTKKPSAKKHACLTSYLGLHELSSYLAERASQETGKDHGAAEYDLYQYDEMLLLLAKDMLKSLGYSLVTR